MFREKLNEYMNMLNCSGKEFAEQSGISEATVSRYKSGARIPASNSEDMKKICRGICAAAAGQGIEITYKTVLAELNTLAETETFDYRSLQSKFNILCTVFSVNLADMSKSLKYDSSYVSRIRSGKRRPANPQKFAYDVAEYIVKYCENDKKIIADIINIKPEEITTRDGLVTDLANWLADSENTEKPANPAKKFLDKLDVFDLNEYIKAIRFDELKVPTLPFQLPLTRSYYGVEEMKNGELETECFYV